MNSNSANEPEVGAILMIAMIGQTQVCPYLARASSIASWIRPLLATIR